VKLTAHLHLLPRLRMNGAISRLPLYAFMEWTGTIVALPSFNLSFEENYQGTKMANRLLIFR
jgi:hypothetical protein